MELAQSSASGAIRLAGWRTHRRLRPLDGGLPTGMAMSSTNES